MLQCPRQVIRASMFRTSQGAAAVERELRLSLSHLCSPPLCMGWGGLSLPNVVRDEHDPQVESLPWSALTPAGAGLRPQGLSFCRLPSQPFSHTHAPLSRARRKLSLGPCR